MAMGDPGTLFMYEAMVAAPTNVLLLGGRRGGPTDGRTEIPEIPTKGICVREEH
jgi:hypothetical protein